MEIDFSKNIPGRCPHCKRGEGLVKLVNRQGLYVMVHCDSCIAHKYELAGMGEIIGISSLATAFDLAIERWNEGEYTTTYLK